MWLVVGLGNPGKQYADTRHNVGFAVVEVLAGRHGFPGWKRSGTARVSRGRIRGEEVMLVEPTTYMNLSGEAVQALVHFYRLEPGRLVVVHDELDFEPGVVRVKQGGGHGGHNGLRSIMAHLGGDFARVRLGIGKPEGAIEGADWVLSSFDRAARQVVDEALARAADAVEVIIGEGVRKAMGLFNRRERADADEESDAE